MLQCPYPFEKAKLVAAEMAQGLALDLVAKGLVTDQIVMTVGYDVENRDYRGEYTTDRYGRRMPKHAHGTHNLGRQTSSEKLISQAVAALFDKIVDQALLVRRLYLTATHVVPEGEEKPSAFEQMSLFSDYEAEKSRREAEEAELEREKRRQQALIAIKGKYGKNAILKGMNFEEGATAKERNETIGGHKA